MNSGMTERLRWHGSRPPNARIRPLGELIPVPTPQGARTMSSLDRAALGRSAGRVNTCVVERVGVAHGFAAASARIGVTALPRACGSHW